MTLNNYRKTLDNKKAVLNSIYDRLDDYDVELEELEKSKGHAEQALIIIQTVAKQTQEQLEYKISELVSLALESVFDEPYKMVLQYETKRNKTEANLLFERNGERFHPLSSAGGGAVDIASFALRVALWSLSIEKTEPTLVLDEPFRFLSRDLLGKAGLMLKEISNKLGLQIIMVSHLEELIDGADKVFQVKQNKGISKVEVL